MEEKLNEQIYKYTNMGIITRENIVYLFLANLQDVELFKNPNKLYIFYKDWCENNHYFVTKKENFFLELGKLLLNTYCGGEYEENKGITISPQSVLKEAFSYIYGKIPHDYLSNFNIGYAIRIITDELLKAQKYDEGYVNISVDELGKQYIEDKATFEDRKLFLRWINMYISRKQELNIAKVILANLPSTYDYITIDKDGSVFIYADCLGTPPVKDINKCCWTGIRKKDFSMYKDIFKYDISWGDEKPTKIKELINKYEQK